jgi:cullin 3
LVINKHGKTLYKEIIESVKRNILPYLEILKKTEESEYLQKINELWDNHNTSLGMVSDISMYLDKNYVVKEKMKSILESGLLLFKKNIF